MKIRNNEDAKASQVDSVLGPVNGLLTAQFDWIENQSEEVQDLFNDRIVAHKEIADGSGFTVTFKFSVI